MNKVITIRLGHYVLTIDEDAAVALGNYTDALRRKYSGEEGSAEIISDIEERIGELLDKKQKDHNRTFNNLQDVNEVISQMGPLDGNPQSEPYTGEVKRRLMRDPENKILAGVWGGIAAYFDIDPVILRIIWAISVFIFGFGIPLYIVLWIVMPEARTTAERLMMRGQRPTLQNIEDNVKAELNEVGKRFKYSQNQDRLSSFFRTLFQYVGIAIMWFFRTVLTFVGVLLIFCFIAAIVGIFTDKAYIHNYNVVLNGQEGINTILRAAGDPMYIKIAIVTTLLLLIAFTGLNIITTNKNRERTKMPRRYLAWASTIAFLIVFVLFFDVMRHIGQRSEKTVYDEVLPVTGDTLYVETNTLNTEMQGLYTLNTFADILPSEDNQFHIEQRNIAYSGNRVHNALRLENAPRNFSLNGNKLMLSQGMRVAALEDKGLGWVTYTLYVPKGKSVKASKHFHFFENNYSPISSKNAVVSIDSTGNLLGFGGSGSEIMLDNHIEELRLSGKLDVQIIPSSTNRMELVSGPIVSNRDWIDAEGSHITIHQTDAFISSQPSYIRLYLKDLSALDIESVSKLHFKNWKTQFLRIECTGASFVDGSLSTDRLEVELEGGAKMNLNGRSDNIYLDASGAAEFVGNDFHTNRATLHCSGASNVTIWAQDEIDAKASGASHISVKGNPRESNVETSGAGSYKKI